MMNVLALKEWLRTFLQHIFTGKDNVTTDIARVMWCSGVITYLVLSGVALYKGQAFDYMNFGVGFGGLMAGSGGSVAIKRKTEPDGKE